MDWQLIPSPARNARERGTMRSMVEGASPPLSSRNEDARTGPRRRTTTAPPEMRLWLRLKLGAVWATRTGQVCGLADNWHTGVDVMMQFYIVDGQVLFRGDEDHESLYVWEWSRYVMDPYVVIHEGNLVTGACATQAGRGACHRAENHTGR